jgi:hypothetical protein
MLYLLSEDVIGEASDGRSVGDKVRDGLHNVPAVFPPCETGQSSELDAHESQSDPSEGCRPSLGSGHH